jgi:hypothetical protein
MAHRAERRAGQSSDPQLPFQWQQVQSAIWLLGLAVLFFTGNWFPGIFVLMAVSALSQAAIYAYVKSGEERRAQAEAQRVAQVRQLEAEDARAGALPPVCPGCGAPLTATTVLWRSATTAACPYCNRMVKASQPTPIVSSTP